MSEMIDRLAQRIQQKTGDEVGPMTARQIARTVVEGIREPNDAMLTAAAGVGEEAEDYPTAVWQAMIDAALAE